MDEEFRRLVNAFERSGNKTGYLKLFNQTELLELINNAIFEMVRNGSEIKVYPTQIDVLVIPPEVLAERYDIRAFVDKRAQLIADHQTLLRNEWEDKLEFHRAEPIISNVEVTIETPLDFYIRYKRSHQCGDGWWPTWFVKDSQIVFSAVAKPRTNTNSQNPEHIFEPWV